jgi:hypothetical protein
MIYVIADKGGLYRSEIEALGFKTREDALGWINEQISHPMSFRVIEGVELALEPVTTVTEMKFKEKQ